MAIKNSYRNLFDEGVSFADAEAAERLCFVYRYVTKEEPDSCRLKRESKMARSNEAYKATGIFGKATYLAGLYIERARNYIRFDEDLFIGP